MWMTIVSRSIDINDINGKYIVHRPLKKFKTGPHATWILKPKKFIFYPQGFLCFSFSVFIFPLHSWVSSFSLFPPFSIWMMTEHRKCMANNTEWRTTGPSKKFIVSSMLSHKKISEWLWHKILCRVKSKENRIFVHLLNISNKCGLQSCNEYF